MAQQPGRQEDVVDLIRSLTARVERIERSQSVPPRYSAANRPAAADVPGLVIYNTTTLKHQGSNGTIWNDFF